MIGFIAFRAARRTAKGAGGLTKHQKPTATMAEVTKSKAGVYAVLTVAVLFVALVVLIGWAVQYCNARY